MRRALTFFLVLILNLTLQSTLFQHMDIRGIVPNTSIIIIISISLLRGSMEGGIAGLFSGLLQDIFFGTSIGFYGLLGMLCGHFAGKFNKGFYRENYALPIFLCLLSTFIYESCVYILGPLFKGYTNYGHFLFSIILPEMVYNAVLAIIIYRILFTINSIVENHEKHKRRLFSIK